MNRIITLSKHAEQLKSKLDTKAGGKFNGVISQSVLRAEVELADAQPLFPFDFKKQKNNPSATELPFLLADNDSFKAFWVRFWIGVKDTTKPSIYVKQTYPNDTAFPTDTAGTLDKTHLEAIYNAGYLSYKKGDTTYLKALGLTDARFVPQTAQSAATNRSSTEQGEGGIIHLARPITMIGTDVGDWNMNIPAANALKLQYTGAGQATLKTVAILELHGLLISGGNKIVTASAE